MKNIDQIEEILQTLSIMPFHDNVRMALSMAIPKGLFLEFGVATGGSLCDTALIRPDLIFHGFDSFEGLPEAWDIYPKGHFKCNIPRVPHNVILHVGWFEDTFPVFLAKYKQNISYANIDSDLYSSAKTIFKHFSDRIVPGTLLRFDEMTGYPTWKEHEYKAFKEFLDENNYDIEFITKEDKDRCLVRIINNKNEQETKWQISQRKQSVLVQA